MSGEGVIFKRCGCHDARDGKRLVGRCPRLAERGHSSWGFHCSVPMMFSRIERVRRGGYPTPGAAHATRDAVLQRSEQERTTTTWTLPRWLVFWLTTRTSIRPSTLRSHQWIRGHAPSPNCHPAQTDTGHHSARTMNRL
jgi:hypothetical protein